jgi:hypothetical protein
MTDSCYDSHYNSDDNENIYFYSGLDYLNDGKIICVYTVLFVPSCVLKVHKRENFLGSDFEINTL